jgi:hypothetical protein
MYEDGDVLGVECLACGVRDTVSGSTSAMLRTQLKAFYRGRQGAFEAAHAGCPARNARVAARLSPLWGKPAGG